MNKNRFSLYLNEGEHALVSKYASQLKWSLSQLIRFTLNRAWPLDSRLERNAIIKKYSIKKTMEYLNENYSEYRFTTDSKKKVVVILSDEELANVRNIKKVSNLKTEGQVVKTILITYVLSKNDMYFYESDYLMPLSKIIKDPQHLK